MEEGACILGAHRERAGATCNLTRRQARPTVYSKQQVRRPPMLWSLKSGHLGVPGFWCFFFARSKQMFHGTRKAARKKALHSVMVRALEAPAAGMHMLCLSLHVRAPCTTRPSDLRHGFVEANPASLTHSLTCLFALALDAAGRRWCVPHHIWHGAVFHGRAQPRRPHVGLRHPGRR